MIYTDKILDLVVRTKDEAHALALSAFNQSHELAIAAKNNEISALEACIEDLRSDLAEERAKAGGLMDRLLVRDAKVGAVAAAVAPAAIAAAIAAEKDSRDADKLKVVFDSLADVGDLPEPKESRAFSLAGGSAVTR